ncbi:hypothetical protein ACH5RR_031553 [Cinchona calisaya]|uniref:Uncharacterized protein n=1 Tax=Cinchona calisaya TaxID=153742 RepID=A0ABD2YHI3_9GENT
MSRSSHHKEKYRNNSELTLVHCNDGTSARTRPFSFEDVMLRRKNKKAGEIQAANGKADSREHNIENPVDSIGTDGYRYDSNSRPLLEDSVRARSRRKEDNTYPINEG